MRRELHDRNGSFHRKDELYVALIRIAQRHDPDSMAIIVALLLPGLLKHANRSWGLDTEDALSELVTALCRRIEWYDTARRPHHVASNLLQDAARTLKRANAKASAHAAHVCSLETTGEILEPHVDVTFTARFLLKSAVEAGIVSASDVALIYLIDFCDASVGDVVRTLGITYEAAKKRRQRARHRWAMWWLDSKEAA